MLSSEQIEQATKVISRILSESAFLFVDPLEDGNKPDLEIWKPKAVSLTFNGNKTGTVSLWAGDDFLVSAAANMLGIDEDSDDASEKGMDALKEILNIIVGNLLTTAYGTEPIFDLGIPERLSPETIKDVYSEDKAVWLETDENPVLFLIDME